MEEDVDLDSAKIYANGTGKNELPTMKCTQLSSLKQRPAAVRFVREPFCSNDDRTLAPAFFYAKLDPIVAVF